MNEKILLLLCMLGTVLWLGKFSAPPLSTPQLCLAGLVLVSQMCFVGLPFFPSASLSLLSFFFLSPTLLDPCATALDGQGFCAWTHFLAFMEWADGIGSKPAAWSYVPVQSSS